MSEPLRLGIAGLGTVGIGVVKIVQGLGETLTTRRTRGTTLGDWVAWALDGMLG